MDSRSHHSALWGSGLAILLAIMTCIMIASMIIHGALASAGRDSEGAAKKPTPRASATRVAAAHPGKHTATSTITPHPTPSPRPTATPQPTVPPDRFVSIGPQSGTQPLLTAILLARKRLLVTTNGLSDAGLLRALATAAHVGVDVRVLYDPAAPDLVGLLALGKQGVLVHPANGAFPQTEQNSIVVDDKSVILSNAAFTPFALTQTRFALVEDTNRIDVLQAAALFYDDWERRDPRDFAIHLVLGPGSYQADLLHLLSLSTRSLDIMTRQLGDADLTAVLLQAARSGIRLRILVSADSALDSTYDLIRAGVNVRRSTSLRTRGTLVIQDDQRALLGGADLSYGGIVLNRSLGILMGDATTVTPLITAFSYDWNQALPIQLPPPTSTPPPTASIPQPATPTPGP